MRIIKKFASIKQTPIYLKNLRLYPDLVRKDYDKHLNLSIKFLSKEIPIRLGTMIDTIDHLPYGFVNLSNVHKIRDWYCESFDDILNTDTNNNNQVFSDKLDNIIKRHDPVIMTMAKGIHEYKRQVYYTDQIKHLIQDFLDDFYINRIGIRLLIKQHLKLFEDEKNIEGIVQENMPLKSVITEAYNDAAFLCDRHYDIVPKLKFISEDINISYIRDHLHYVFFELIKNSMGAIGRTYDENNDKNTDLVINLSQTDEIVSIKISDTGKGIALDDIDKIFQYAYSTGSSSLLEEDYDYRTSVPPMEGFGYGLQMSKLYSEYFNGKIKLCSQDGYGTDVFIYLRK